MPEGHTLHRLARQHRLAFGGSPVTVSSPQGRFTGGAELVSDRKFLTAEAWGKHLLHHYEGGRSVHIHLGLYGAFSLEPAPLEPPVGQVRMRISNAEWGADLRGPTRCEVVGAAEVEALFARLGPDPLRADADPEVAWQRVARSKASIAVLLMDQKVLAGVGNVYRAEILFRQRIAPDRPGCSLLRSEWDALWRDICALLPVGVEQGRMITVRDEHDHGAGAYEPGRPRTYVYRRTGEPCRICGTQIMQNTVQGRKLYWCPTCQC
ncbi:Fpg/Nei family DNA glycosylase [Hoyosella rhizosphaerae]|uniref:Fpg/Nei family DNA glycosylase n=1 Tax=Hoyosella rhizosphaerae TaxID=1755582 RepID=UPI001667A7E3|nr:Fpg/Nei family DNA glycosylase [Hoyosella rhizosphaerae]MBN4928108.1 Fpg/Nei family DNA glycosylase [Hoyosella rhizosphaerae]